MTPGAELLSNLTSASTLAVRSTGAALPCLDVPTLLERADEYGETLRNAGSEMMCSRLSGLLHDGQAAFASTADSILYVQDIAHVSLYRGDEALTK